MSEPLLTVVIPTLNSAASLPATLAALAEGRAVGPDGGVLVNGILVNGILVDEVLVDEVLVVDAGSTDATTAIARQAGARVMPAPRGRGQQLATGGASATGAWLLFIHADAKLEPGWAAAARAFIADPANRQRAAAFRLRLDDPDPRARRIERLAAWRARALGLPYGDQGLLIARRFYESIGGFRPLSLMEDVDIVRRIGRRRLALLDKGAETSAARYRRDGWLLRPLRNLTLLTGYFLGVPPGILERYYE